MVVYILYCSAELEGVEKLVLNKDSVNLCFSVRNPQDHAQIREKIVVETEILHKTAVSGKEKHRDESLHHFGMKWDHGDSARCTLRVLGANSVLDEEMDLDQNYALKQHKNKKLVTSEQEKALAQIKEAMKSEDSGQLVPLLALDCQGMEPYAFHPMGEEFTVVGVSGGKVYENVDLSDGDWSDYELSTGSVSVTKFQSKFQ